MVLSLSRRWISCYGACGSVRRAGARVISDAIRWKPPPDVEPAARESFRIVHRVKPSSVEGGKVLLVREERQFVAFGEILNGDRCADQVVEG